MDNKSKLLGEITKFSGFNISENLSKDNATKLLSLVGEQRLKEAHVRLLIETVPSFIILANESLRTISDITKGAKESQKDALLAIQNSINGLTDVLGRFAEQADTDETREKMAFSLVEAGKLYIEVCKIVKEMNENNNYTWVKIAGFASFVVLGVAYVLSGGKTPVPSIR